MSETNIPQAILLDKARLDAQTLTLLLKGYLNEQRVEPAPSARATYGGCSG